ncbi:MAG TPA: cytochrome c1 [Acetobacteraceae bacterium]|jgi:ubiquinol-cytochrome c reductase cytochrome c1 subunit|nr:cytochrome c1 [Acetobacteraceae bacterium]
MRALKTFAAAALLSAVVIAAPAFAQEDAPTPPSQNWSFNGVFGGLDLAAAQRGFQVYSEVCSVCHSMNLLHYRDLEGIGLTDDQIKAVAAAVTVPLGVDDSGDPKTGPGTPASMFRAPFANEQAARAAMNGALPPDLSVIVNAREGHANYVYAILTGFRDAPPGFKMMGGMNYNEYFPGHQIAMPQPLHDGQVTFADGAPNRIEDEAHDVVTFLYWAANPEAIQRKQIGVRVVLFLIFMTGVTYAVKRKVWADVH